MNRNAALSASLAAMAITLTVVVGYFSVIGIGQFTASVAVPAMFLAAVIEVIKIALAGWMKQNWRALPWGLRLGGVGFIAIAMVITALGVHNYLMTAHNTDDIKRTQTKAEIAVLVKTLEADTAQRDFIQTQLAQLSREYERYVDAGSITKSRAARQADRENRHDLTEELREVQTRINAANTEIARMSVAVTQMEASLGPATTLRNLLGVDEASAVNLYTFLFLLVGDPLAVFLSIAAVWQLSQARKTEVNATGKVAAAAPLTTWRVGGLVKNAFARIVPGKAVSKTEFDRIAAEIEQTKAGGRSAKKPIVRGVKV